MSSPTSVSAVFPVSNRKLAPEKSHQTRMPHIIWLLKNLTIAAHPDKVFGFHAFSGGSPESPHLYPRRASLIPEITLRSAAGNHRASRKGSPQDSGPPKNGHFGGQALKTLTFICRSVPLCLTTRLFRPENQPKPAGNRHPADTHRRFYAFCILYSGRRRGFSRSAPEEAHLSK